MRDRAIDAASPRAPDTTLERPRRLRKTGIPAPVTFDFDALPASSWLTTEEVAAILRKAPVTVAMWRQKSCHPLKWERIDGKPLYRVGWVRQYMAAGVRQRTVLLAPNAKARIAAPIADSED